MSRSEPSRATSTSILPCAPTFLPAYQHDSTVFIFSAADGARAADPLPSPKLYRASSRELLRRNANHNRPHHLSVQYGALWCNQVTVSELVSRTSVLLFLSYHTVAYYFYEALSSAFAQFSVLVLLLQSPPPRRSQEDRPFSSNSRALDSLTARSLGTETDLAVALGLPVKLLTSRSLHQ